MFYKLNNYLLTSGKLKNIKKELAPILESKFFLKKEPVPNLKNDKKEPAPIVTLYCLFNIIIIGGRLWINYLVVI